jgi:hypothetical protein
VKWKGHPAAPQDALNRSEYRADLVAPSGRDLGTVHDNRDATSLEILWHRPVQKENGLKVHYTQTFYLYAFIRDCREKAESLQSADTRLLTRDSVRLAALTDTAWRTAGNRR